MQLMRFLTCDSEQIESDFLEHESPQPFYFTQSALVVDWHQGFQRKLLDYNLDRACYCWWLLDLLSPFKTTAVRINQLLNQWQAVRPLVPRESQCMLSSARALGRYFIAELVIPERVEILIWKLLVSFGGVEPHSWLETPVLPLPVTSNDAGEFTW